MSGDEPAGETEPDRVRTPPRQRRSVARAMPALLTALAEGFLRDSMIIGTAALGLFVAAGGLLAGSAGQGVTGVVGGVGGAVLVLVAVAKHWSIGRQWLTVAIVLAVQIGLIAVWTS